MSRALTPHTVLHRGSATYRFFLGDCVEILPQLSSGSVQTIVTSPPYNLGISYRTYEDRLPSADYLAWTGQWIEAVSRVLDPLGSLFLNVGSKPTDPWTAFDVAQAVRPHLQLQNTLHWVKSIAIDQDAAGGAAGLTAGLAVGHYKPINSPRFVNDCHEFIFHFTPTGRTPLDRLAVGVPYQDESNIGRWRGAGSGLRCRGNTWFLPYETIQDRNEDRPHPATFPPRLPEDRLRLHGRDRITRGCRPVPWPRSHGSGVRPARVELCRNRNGRRLSARSGGPDAGGTRPAARAASLLIRASSAPGAV